METSIPDIYAVGDAVQVKHYVTGQDALISLAGPANKQGDVYKRQRLYRGLWFSREFDFGNNYIDCLSDMEY